MDYRIYDIYKSFFTLDGYHYWDIYSYRMSVEILDIDDWDNQHYDSEHYPPTIFELAVFYFEKAREESE